MNFRPKITAIFAFSANLVIFASIPEQYQTIVERNPFGLNPYVPPPTNAVQIVPSVDIKLTGFSEAAGQLKAYFVAQSKDLKEPPRYISLGEGQSDAALELVQIYANEGEVRIRNSGQEVRLSLKNDGLKGAPSSMLGTSAQPVAMNPVPTINNQGSENGGLREFNQSSVVWTGGKSSVLPSSRKTTGPTFLGQQVSGQGGLPSRNAVATPSVVFSSGQGTGQAGTSVSGAATSSVVFSPNQNSTVTQSAPEQPLDPAAQLAIMTLYHEAKLDNNLPAGPPPPPIPPTADGTGKTKPKYIAPPPPAPF